MKRFNCLFLLLFCFSWSVTQAQEHSLPKGFTTGDIVWIVRAGANLNNVSGSGVEDVKESVADTKGYIDFNSTLGGAISGGLYSPLGASSFYFGMNIGIGMRGYKTIAKWQGNSNSLNTQKVRLTAFNAQISPLNIGYIFKLSENSALDFHLGTFFSCDFAGSFKTVEEYSDDSTKDYSLNINDDKDYEKYDVGIVGGIGLWYNHWLVDLNYQRGIAPMEKGGMDLFSNVFQLSVGYAF